MDNPSSRPGDCRRYAEEFIHIADTFYREKRLQDWSRAKKIAFMEEEWDRLHILAACRNGT